jgi:hypothetical protein
MQKVVVDLGNIHFFTEHSCLKLLKMVRLCGVIMVNREGGTMSKVKSRSALEGRSAGDSRKEKYVLCLLDGAPRDHVLHHLGPWSSSPIFYC